MLLSVLIPSGCALGLERITLDSDAHMLTISVISTQQEARCPLCQCPTARIHSRYGRTVADLPWGGAALRWRLTVRRFFCPNPACHRKIFTERLPALVTPWARRTIRLREAMCRIAFALGGAAGVRLAQALAMPTQIDTLLRLLRTLSLPDRATPRVLGVDDWARRKGHTYGTILVDLEQGTPVDLLPDREAATFAQWLKDHPGVEIISRDRAEAYAQGATEGAPQAQQVADRWHLLKNLGEVLERLFSRSDRLLRASRPPTPPPAEAPGATPSEASPPLSRAEQRKAHHRTARLARYEQVRTLHQQGMNTSAIARQTGFDRQTVSRFLHAPVFPERQPRAARSRLLAPYTSYLHERVTGAQVCGARLLQEITAQGYRGGASIFYAAVSAIRQAKGVPMPTRRGLPPTEPPFSIRALVGLILRPAETLEAHEQGGLETLRTSHPAVEEARCLAQAFTGIVRERQPDALDAWLQQAAQSTEAAWRGFVASLRQDLQAVRAAVSLPWSNGPTEGHINRLKCLKRQMYGRAKFDLLRLRFLSAA